VDVYVHAHDEHGDDAGADADEGEDDMDALMQQRSRR
jgi:hypothetical protein